jgi:hypothetical protein
MFYKRLRIKNLNRSIATLVMLIALGVFVSKRMPVYASTSCPPSDAVWTNNAKYTGEPYPKGVGNLYGYDYYLNNDQYNEQPTSNQTMWLESDNDFGICSYQPTTPSDVKAYPSVNLNLADPVGSSPPQASPAIDTFTTISSTVTESQPSSTYGSFQWMWDIFAGSTTPGDQTEVEIITNRDESGTPPGTSMGTATIGSIIYNVYYTHALSDGHLYYSFVAQENNGTAKAAILRAFEWLNYNAPKYGLSFPLTMPLNSIAAGWEINNVSNGSSGPNGGFAVTNYSLTLSSAP